MATGDVPEAASAPGPVAVARQMAVALSRLLRDGETVFFGVASPLPMVAALVARQLHAPNLTLLTIAGGVSPSPVGLPLSTADPALLAGAAALVTLADIFDLSARGRLDTAFLSGVQIDRRGRINMSAIGDPRRPTVRLPGGAGSAALMPTARRTVLWRTRHDRRTFVPEVEFVTASGNVEHVVTPLCVFERRAGLLRLASVHPFASVAAVAAQTGFPLDADPATPVTPPPTAEEVAALEAVDPTGVVAAELLAR